MNTSNFLEQRRFDATVIGAGIVGLSCALSLAKRGLRVAILDKGEVGRGCSYGNAGWVTPCFAMPLPMPGMFWKSIKWLLDSDSPLHIKPVPSLELARWLWDFLKNMNEEQASRAIEALVELSLETQSMYAEIAKKADPKIDYRQKGLLMVSRNSAGLAAAEDELRRMEKVKIQGELLGAQRIRDLEPALQGEFHGGVYFPNESSVEPFELVQVLKTEVESFGGQIFCGTEVIDFASGESRKIGTTRGDFFTDHLIFCTGSWSRRFSQILGIRIPVLGGKGYSLIFPELAQQPKIPIMYVEKKIAITPRRNSLRVAGTLELVLDDDSLDQRRVSVMRKGAEGILSLPSELPTLELWRGLRPCTPDGLPLIGPVPGKKNIWLACGHQMLGLQTAGGTGELLSALICGETQASKRAQIFQTNRF